MSAFAFDSMPAIPRTERWKHETVETQLRLVANDLDVGEAARNDMARALDSLKDSVDERLTKIMWALISVALSFAVAAASFVLTGMAR